MNFYLTPQHFKILYCFTLLFQYFLILFTLPSFPLLSPPPPSYYLSLSISISDMIPQKKLIVPNTLFPPSIIYSVISTFLLLPLTSTCNWSITFPSPVPDISPTFLAIALPLPPGRKARGRSIRSTMSGRFCNAFSTSWERPSPLIVTIMWYYNKDKNYKIIPDKQTNING